MEDKYKYVDLGLPSGTLWATTPITNDNGEVLYFQWGDTQGWTAQQIQNGEKSFDVSNYKWYSNGSYTKYNTTDSKKVLDLEDDAAHVLMGGNWKMPTSEQLNELMNNTRQSWATKDGVIGRLFTSKTNGNSLFLPTVGSAYNTNVDDVGSDGCIWSSSLLESTTSYVRFLFFDSSLVSMYFYYRHYGYCVVGVVGE